MGLFMAIAPVVIVGGIVVYVIARLTHQYNQGNLATKKSKGSPHLLGSFIPMGMLFGGAIGVILGMFFPISLVLTVNLGSAIGFLLGFFAFNIFSKKGIDYS